MIVPALCALGALVCAFASGWVLRGRRKEIAMNSALAAAVSRIDQRVRQLEGGRHG